MASAGSVENTSEQEQTLVNEVSGLSIAQSDGRPSDESIPPSREFGESPEKTENNEEEIMVAERSLLQKIIWKGLMDTKAQLEVKQKDPTSPLYSAKSFEDLKLRPELLKGVYAMGFNTPSRIQESALPILLGNPPQNLIAQSPSGTGKTTAFVLAMLSRVDTKLNYPQILCLSPLYELAVQTGEVISQMGQFCPEIQVVFAVRGYDIHEKLTAHIIIGTPGKIIDWAFRHRFFDVSKIRVFVLDEADVMIATQGYQDMSIKLHRKLPPNCQKMLFSATYEENVMRFAEKLIPDATILRLKREEGSLDNIKQFYIQCKDSNEKYRAITDIYEAITIEQAMIFCQSRNTASWLASQLTKDGRAVGLWSGDLTVDQRIAVLNRFRDAQERILITTNLMALGVDVGEVTVVVNYDLPVDMNKRPDCEMYLRRIGRMGRFGKAGIVINLVDSSRSMSVLRQIEVHFGKPILKLYAEEVIPLADLHVKPFQSLIF